MEEKKFIAERDYYDFLGIDGSATIQEVQQAYERLSSKIILDHPCPEQRAKSAERMLIINIAYETLNSPVKRSQYDIAHKFRKRQENSKVEDLFNEGLRYFRVHKMDNAINCFKQTVVYHPHKALYRVHLALAYADKGMPTLAKNELQTALKIEPNNEFAQEVTAKVMFKLPDKKELVVTNRFWKQAAILLIAFVLVAGTFTAQIPQKIANAANRAMQQMTQKSVQVKEGQNSTYKYRGSELSPEVVNEIKSSQPLKQPGNKEVTKFKEDYMPQGQCYDYTKQEALKKTYYPEQGIMVVNYKDGSVLTYKPTDLIGWKIDTNSKQAVMITKNNELIPAPASLPVLQPNGDMAKIGGANYPANLFPEYSKDNETPVANTNNNNQVSVNNNQVQTTVPNNTPPVVGQVPQS